MPLREFINRVYSGETLSEADCRRMIAIVKKEDASPAQWGALLGSLHTRGETDIEISGIARALLEEATLVKPKRSDLIDTCGTGGDGANTFNISTTVSFVVAAGGLGVAKHGNRSVSSQCGSADVLEELGVPTDLSPEAATQAIDEKGYAFLFAPLYHPVIGKIASIRRSLGVRTLFNVMGPLINPARARYQVLGVFSQKYLQKMARASQNLGVERLLVVSSDDGLDEISIAADTQAALLLEGKVEMITIRPEDVGVSRRENLSELQGGDKAFNARILTNVLGGQEGAKADAVAINAGAALWMGKKANDLKEGVVLAREILNSKKGLQKLEEVRA